MNNDFLRYKSKFLTFALLLGYTYIHTKLTGTLTDVTLQNLFDFSARLPFGQRLLTPAIAHFFSYFLPFSIDELFFIIEWLFISLSYWALFHLLSIAFPPKQARLMSWLFFLLLPLISVINYRYTIDGEATFFYPYDSTSLFFMIIGFLFCMQSRWIYFIPLLFAATINRESSILLVLMLPALHWQNLRSIRIPFFLAVITYTLARLLVLSLINRTHGQILEWYFHGSQHTNFETNLMWLFNQQHILLFLFCFAGLPLFWFAFYDYIPLQYRPLKYVMLFYFLSLSLVGIFPEARIFTEIVVLFYLPTCIAISRWLSDLMPYETAVRNLYYYVDRYAVLVVLALLVVFHQPLNNWVIWLSHHSP